MREGGEDLLFFFLARHSLPTITSNSNPPPPLPYPPTGCVQETLKLLTGMSQSIANETFFNGEVGQNISTDVLARKEQGKCLHCSHTPTFTIALPATSTLGELVEKLNGPAFQLKNVTIGPKGWVPWTREESNLEKKLVDLGLQSVGALAMVVKDFNTSDGTLIVNLT